jgi:hypothetical protein
VLATQLQQDVREQEAAAAAEGRRSRNRCMLVRACMHGHAQGVSLEAVRCSSRLQGLACSTAADAGPCPPAHHDAAAVQVVTSARGSVGMHDKPPAQPSSCSCMIFVSWCADIMCVCLPAAPPAHICLFVDRCSTLRPPLRRCCPTSRSSRASSGGCGVTCYFSESQQGLYWSSGRV